MRTQSNERKTVYEHTVYLRATRALNWFKVQVAVKRFGKKVVKFSEVIIQEEDERRAILKAFVETVSQGPMLITNVRIVTDSNYLGLVANYFSKKQGFERRFDADLYPIVKAQLDCGTRRIQFIETKRTDLDATVIAAKQEFAKMKQVVLRKKRSQSGQIQFFE